MLRQIIDSILARILNTYTWASQEWNSLIQRLLTIYNYIKRQWRAHVKLLLLIIVKSISAYFLTFIITVSIFTAFTPEYPEHKLHIIFRVYQGNLVGVALRPQLMSSACAPSEHQYIFNSKFPKAQICYLKHQPFPELVNRDFNLLVEGVDPKCKTVVVCWLRHKLKEEVCEELVVNGGMVMAQSIDILSVDLVEVVLKGEEKKGGFVEPTVLLQLNEGVAKRWVRKMFRVVSLVLSHGLGITITIGILAYEAVKLWHKAKVHQTKAQ